MSRGFDRRLERTAAKILVQREPEPDFTGWSDNDVVMWKIRNGTTLSEMIEASMDGWEEKLKAAAEERERERLAYEASQPKPEQKSAPKPKRKRRGPGQPKPEPQWWEERARWRLRGPEDYASEDIRPNECIHEYDPLTYDDEDWEEE